MKNIDYKLAFFVMVRNQIMASPCPEEPAKIMIDKYDRKHINRVARLTIDHAIDSIDYKRAEKEMLEAEKELEKRKK